MDAKSAHMDMEQSVNLSCESLIFYDNPSSCRMQMLLLDQKAYIKKK